MSRLATFRKYFLWFLGLFLLSTILIYIGLNARYKNIESLITLPDGVKMNLAQATSVNGRILGEVISTNDRNLEGKYLKVNIFSKKDELVGTKYLKIQDTKINEPKKFAVYFSAENVKAYTIDVLDDSEEIEKEELRVKDLFKDTFTSEELKVYGIIGLVLYAMI